jgi:undecaprenyl diphosphate synthase
MLVHRYYEWRLERELKYLPDSLCFMLTGHDLTDAPEKIQEVAGWCIRCGIKNVIFHINTDNLGNPEIFLPYLRDISSFAKVTITYDDKTEVSGEGADVYIVIGMSGRDEIVRCVRKMAEDNINPADVDEKMIESYLTFNYEPDLVIKTGGSHLTDFLIWQSVYSELFFSDVNWKQFRKTEFLRALRDYQTRKRRYGK